MLRGIVRLMLRGWGRASLLVKTSEKSRINHVSILNLVDRDCTHCGLGSSSLMELSSMLHGVPRTPLFAPQTVARSPTVVAPRYHDHPTSSTACNATGRKAETWATVLRPFPAHQLQSLNFSCMQPALARWRHASTSTSFPAELSGPGIDSSCNLKPSHTDIQAAPASPAQTDSRIAPGATGIGRPLQAEAAAMAPHDQDESGSHDAVRTGAETLEDASNRGPSRGQNGAGDGPVPTSSFQPRARGKRARREERELSERLSTASEDSEADGTGKPVEDQERVSAGGYEGGPHIPVLLDEVLRFFRGRELRTYVDGTLGAGITHCTWSMLHIMQINAYPSYVGARVMHTMHG